MPLRPDPKPADQRLQETKDALKAIRAERQARQQAKQQSGKK